MNGEIKSRLYDALRKSALDEARSLPCERCRIRGAWTMRLAFQPNRNERLFKYDVAIVQTEQQGTAYGFLGGVDNTCLNKLVGRDVRECICREPSTESVACLDALCGSLSHEQNQRHTISGLSSEMALARAKIVVDEVVGITSSQFASDVHVANIGAIGNVVGMLVDAGFRVTPTDLERDLVGNDLYGCTVLDGALHSERIVREADVAVITAMTLATGAIDGLITAAVESNTKIVVIAETGAWIGSRFLCAEPIHCVVSEPFPYYIFSGSSIINIHTRR